METAEAPQRIPCQSCGAMVLSITAERYNGRCKPCFDSAPEGPVYYFLDLDPKEVVDQLNSHARSGWTVVSHATYRVNEDIRHTFTLTSVGKYWE